MLKHFASAALVAVAAVGLTPTAQAEGDMEAITIELPKANFGGTPLDYWGENLEERDFKDRPPFMAPAGTTNVALNKDVTASTGKALLGSLKMATDGNKEYDEKNVVEIDEGFQYIQIDLGEECDIYAVLLWHFHAAERVYFDVEVKVAEDADFTKGVETIFNNDHDNSSGAGVGKDKEYVETYKGKLIDAGGVKGRYVRLYSNGNTSDQKNHYTEVEVFGKPAK